MVSRGPVYHTQETAGAGTNRRFEGAGEYKFHDNCDCTVYPLFEGQRWEPPAYVLEWDELYVRSTAGIYGTKPKLRAWRKAFEGGGDEDD